MAKLQKQILIGIVIISVVLRFWQRFIWQQGGRTAGTFDQISYHNLALRVLSGTVFHLGAMVASYSCRCPHIALEFLYTFYLILVYKIFGPNALVPG
jgi:hypothetical protein